MLGYDDNELIPQNTLLSSTKHWSSDSDLCHSFDTISS